ncbi:hypothetical protein [Testudinibacter sp. TR-2022]|uniref:hypothetical protein n=1 Tax=Testudinibacter sp. TR-2022 TaxID=2585029 RepID=UPI001119CC23|nr:hypothetical protein [Testudinibacter sp. TR-2022]TNH18262.1 hypothetical protein FHQ29_13190 [Testudinibacter sp. TR-2022]
MGQQVSVNVMLGAVTANSQEELGANVLGAVGGTMGSKISSNIVRGGHYLNTIGNLVIPTVVGEYLGDSDRMRSNIEKLKVDYDSNR